MIAVDLAIRLVLLDLEVVLPVFHDWRVVHDRVPGPRSCPLLGLDGAAWIGPVLSRRNRWLLKLWSH